MSRPLRPPRETAHPSETALSAACQSRIRKGYGGEVFKVHGGPSQSKGQPDLLGCIPTAGALGRMIAVELKQPGNKPTPLQYKRLRAWEQAGALAGWVTTEAELVELLGHLEERGWANPQLVPAPVLRSV
jgi:hypothetical protein